MLLRCACASCLNLFTEDTMENSTACWHWILSARHDLTLPFMQEMIAAWQVSSYRLSKCYVSILNVFVLIIKYFLELFENKYPGNV